MGTLTGWTHPYAPFGVPLVDRDEAEAAIGAFLDHVESEARLPNLVLLPLVARDGAFSAALARVLARRGGASVNFGEHARALLAPRKRDSYLDHIAHKKLKELRRQRRRLEEQARWCTWRRAAPPPPSRSPTSWRWKPRAGKAAPAAPRARMPRPKRSCARP